MKGSPKLPSCGFSARAVEALMNCKVPFGYVDILQHADIRAELPVYANWPTFPQLWVEGELLVGVILFGNVSIWGVANFIK